MEIKTLTPRLVILHLAAYLTMYSNIGEAKIASWTHLKELIVHDCTFRIILSKNIDYASGTTLDFSILYFEYAGEKQ